MRGGSSRSTVAPVLMAHPAAVPIEVHPILRAPRGYPSSVEVSLREWRRLRREARHRYAALGCPRSTDRDWAGNAGSALTERAIAAK